MQKKIIALAIASALTAPAAFADSSNVTVYGLLNADFESVHSNNVAAANKGSVTRMASNASRLGIKGSEDLGDGLKGIYQLEIEVDVNGEKGTGFGRGTRNSGVGLDGGFGKVILGNWDTPYKVTHNKVELFDNTTFATALNILGRTDTSKGANMNTRLKQSVQYWTPNMNGFNASIAYGVDNAAAVASNASVLSLAANYENEMFYAAYGYQKTNDKNLVGAGVAAVGNSANGNRLVGAYKFDQGLAGLTYERLSNTTAGVSATRGAWELMGKYKFGASSVAASYTTAGNMTNTVNTGARQLSLRYGYNFSKRTELYGIYTSLNNDAGASYDLTNGVNGGITGSAVGSNKSGFGVGMVHKF